MGDTGTESFMMLPESFTRRRPVKRRVAMTFLPKEMNQFLGIRHILTLGVISIAKLATGLNMKERGGASGCPNMILGRTISTEEKEGNK